MPALWQPSMSQIPLFAGQWFDPPAPCPGHPPWRRWDLLAVIRMQGEPIEVRVLQQALSFSFAALQRQLKALLRGGWIRWWCDRFTQEDLVDAQ